MPLRTAIFVANSSFLMWRSKCAALSIKINRGNNETHSKKPPTEWTLSLFLSVSLSLRDFSGELSENQDRFSWQ